MNTSRNRRNHMLLNLVLTGDYGVGKTCIIRRYIENQFNGIIMGRILPDFYTQTLRLDCQHLKVKIFDTASQERFLGTQIRLYRGSNGAMLVYSIINRKSFEHCVAWLENIRDKLGQDLPILLVGSQLDRATHEAARAVTFEEGKTFANRNRLMFIEVSAFSGENIKLAFMRLVAETFKSVATSTPLTEAPVAIGATQNWPAPDAGQS